MLEAALLVGRELWDSTRARLFEGPGACALVSTRRGVDEGTSDVWFTVLPTRGALDEGGSVAVILTSPGGSHYGRLDARGCCVIRGVPDGRYRIGMYRVPDVVHGHGHSVLAVPVDRLRASCCWTSGDTRVIARSMGDDWRTIQVEANVPRSRSDVEVGRVVDGRVELRSAHLTRTRPGCRPAATVRFESSGDASLVCLPLL